MLGAQIAGKGRGLVDVDVIANVAIDLREQLRMLVIDQVHHRVHKVQRTM